MRACWLKWVGRDWSISADYIWLNYSDANRIEIMHQLIILGNGFDLACGLKSKFSDFTAVG